MIARSLPVADRAPAPQARRRRLPLAGLFAVHLASALLGAELLTTFLGRKELEIVGPFALGFVCGQAVLLGQFLLLGTRHPALRTVLAVVWFGLIAFLGRSTFRAIGLPNALVGGCFIFGVPLLCSSAICMALRQQGWRIALHDPRANAVDREAFQFSLRRLFTLTFLAAILLACMRVAREAIDSDALVILLFGGLPLAMAFAFLPWIAPWAALGARHATWRCAATLFIALASAVIPAFIGEASLKTCWSLVCPVVTQSLIVIGTLAIARTIGYRYTYDPSLAAYARIRYYPPRF